MSRILALLPPVTLAGVEKRHLLAGLAALLLVSGALFGAFTYQPFGLGGDAPESGTGAGAAAATEVPPPPQPLEFMDVPPADAVAMNASVPIADLPNPAARPFSLAGVATADRALAIDCLTAAVYYEAAIEPLDGQRAVAQVVLNRTRHPAYPNSVCAVVYQGAERRTGCQFTFTCDGSLRRLPSTAGWARARQVAEAALDGYVFAPVGWATHYHTNWVVPYWSSSLTKLANVGTHIFYRWAGSWGLPAAFRSRYAGAEPNIMRLSDLAGMPEGTMPEDLLTAESDVAAETAEERSQNAASAIVPSFANAVRRAPATAAPRSRAAAAEARAAAAEVRADTVPAAAESRPATTQPAAYRSALSRVAPPREPVADPAPQ